jgi:phosphate:Na+ symporter
MNYGFLDFITLIGALGFFIYGMKVMSDGIQKAAGAKMRQILSAMTSNRVFGIFTGFLITTLVQSSSATTVMVVSFVNAGLLTLIESIGVIMGANIGTTITAWLISIFGFKVKIAAVALPIIAVGFPMLFTRRGKLRSWGEVLIGFALLFMGLDALKNSVPNLQDNPEILAFLQSYTDMGIMSIIIFVIVGTIVTIIVQSSSAAMALTLVMCNEGWIPFPIAAAMILGENIGTTITANLAAIVANVHAKRAARAHFVFNVFGVLWMIAVFPYFIGGIDRYMVNSPIMVGKGGYEVVFKDIDDFQKPILVSKIQERAGIDPRFVSYTWNTDKKGNTLLSIDYKRTEAERVDYKFPDQLTAKINSSVQQAGLAVSLKDIMVLGNSPSKEAIAIPMALSLFHSAFNILNVLLLVWFVPFIAKTVIKLLPAKGEEDEVFHLDYIGHGLMDTAELSLLEARKEISKFGSIVGKLYNNVPKMMNAVEDKKFEKTLEKVKKYEDITDRMEFEIALYLSKVSEGELSRDGSQRVRTMLSIITDLESIGDLVYQIGLNLERRRESKAYFTPDLRIKADMMIEKVGKSIELLQRNLNMSDERVSITEAANLEEEINSLRTKLRNEHMKNIEEGKYKVQAGMYYIDLIHTLERVADYAYDINKALVQID